MVDFFFFEKDKLRPCLNRMCVWPFMVFGLSWSANFQPLLHLPSSANRPSQILELLEATQGSAPVFTVDDGPVIITPVKGWTIHGTSPTHSSVELSMCCCFSSIREWMLFFLMNLLLF